MEIDFDHILEWNEYVKLVAGLFAVADPFGVVPVFLAATAAMTAQAKSLVIWTITLTFLVVCLLFTFAGEAVLGVFGISVDAFKVAGGVLLLVNGLAMLRDPIEAKGDGPGTHAEDPLSVAFVPLAIPLVAGPGSMTTVIVFGNAHPALAHKLCVAAAVVAVTASIFVIFRAAVALGPLLEGRIAFLMHRVMGLILLAIAVELILGGIQSYLDLGAAA